MPEVRAQINPFMGYEHRDKDGKVISIGKTRLLRHQRVEFTQETGTGQKMYQSTQLTNGILLEEKFYDDRGKEADKLVYAYDEKGELLSVTDKVGVVSLSQLAVDKITN
jgi:hypothetical protein